MGDTNWKSEYWQWASKLQPSVISLKNKLFYMIDKIIQFYISIQHCVNV